MDVRTTTLICICIIFAATTLGSALVFVIRRNLSIRISDMILGFASGIMIAAALFGLIVPAIEQSELVYPNMSVIPVVAGFIIGGLILYGLDKVIPHFHNIQNEEEGPKSNLSQQFKFMLAVTIHNIPEGLSVGFACAAALGGGGEVAAASALALAIGIAIQNVPEGVAVSVPMFEEGASKGKSFLCGVISGAVEPVAAILAIVLATSLTNLLPWLLAFAGGAMLYVTIDELLPSARKSDNTHFGLWSFMVGFAIMMVLEVVLG